MLEPAKTVLGAHPKPTTGMRSSSNPVVPSPTNPYPVDSAFTPSIKTGASFVMANLFPFPEGYTFYSRACLGADPSKQVANYFSNYSGKLTLVPGGSGAVTVYEPHVDLTVVRSDGGNPTGTVVYAYPKAAGCTGVRIPFGSVLTSSGKLTYPGLPYGDYDICAYRSGTTNRRGVGTVLVNDPAGVTMPNLTIASSSVDCGNTAPDSNP